MKIFYRFDCSRPAVPGRSEAGLAFFTATQRRGYNMIVSVQAI
jgi:hypothetical protein